jgi:hypothetical protein
VPSYLDITFTNNPIFGTGIYDAWCGDANTYIDLYGPANGPFTGTFNAAVYSINELSSNVNTIFPNGIPSIQNLDEINWLINQNFSLPGTGYTFQEVQSATWSLLGQNWQAAAALEGYNAASTAGWVVNAAFTNAVNALDAAAALHSNYVPNITDGNPADANILMLLAPTSGGVAQQATLVSVESAALGDFVWNDTNGDGIQNDGVHLGIAGVVVNLERDGTILQTTTTDQNGHYEFVGLAPGLTYQVQVVAPSGDIFTKQYATGPDANNTVANDSNVNAQGLSGTIILNPGQNNTTIDAGLIQLSSLSGTVYEDDLGTGSLVVRQFCFDE